MTNRFDVRDLHPAFGSEVVGLDLQAPLDDETTDELRALFDERGLLLLRAPDLSLTRQRELSFALIGRRVERTCQRTWGHVGGAKTYRYYK